MEDKVRHFTVSQLEIFQEPHTLMSSYFGDQLPLKILKRKGAPVKGTLFLYPDTDNYEWVHEAHPWSGQIHVTVTRRVQDVPETKKFWQRWFG